VRFRVRREKGTCMLVESPVEVEILKERNDGDVMMGL
jgi:hypothetical protein